MRCSCCKHFHCFQRVSIVFAVFFISSGHCHFYRCISGTRKARSRLGNVLIAGHSTFVLQCNAIPCFARKFVRVVDDRGRPDRPITKPKADVCCLNWACALRPSDSSVESFLSRSYETPHSPHSKLYMSDFVINWTSALGPPMFLSPDRGSSFVCLQLAVD